MNFIQEDWAQCVLRTIKRKGLSRPAAAFELKANQRRLKAILNCEAKVSIEEFLNSAKWMATNGDCLYSLEDFCRG
jgi:hypothetical protein